MTLCIIVFTEYDIIEIRKKGGEMLKYCKIISFGLLCFGLTITTSTEIKADYFTDYNTTVMDTVLRDNIFNFDLFSRSRSYSLPVIKNNLIQSNMEELEYSAELLSYKKNSYNYLIFYSLDNNNIPNEIFRIQLKNSGAGKIVDKSLLKLFVPNSRIIMNVMSYEIDNKGNIENLEYSKSSQIYFTKKNINLVVTEGKKEVVNRTIELRNSSKDDKVSVLPYEIEQYYRPDKYYSYTKAKIVVDGKETSLENLEVPYLAKKIEVQLTQDKDYWNNVKIEYPSVFKKNNKEFSIKQGVSFGNFIKENISKDLRDKYEVIHYNSGKCRATNEYIKYDSIIFFGEWFNNSFHAERLSEVLNTKIESKDLVKSEIVQAIFRTQARIGKSVSNAFFYNYNEKLLDGYDSFEESINSILNIEDSDFKRMATMRRILSIMETELNKNTLKKVKNFICKMNILDLQNEIMEIKTSLKELNDIVDHKFKSRRDVIPLQNALMEYLNIHLTL